MVPKPCLAVIVGSLPDTFCRCGGPPANQTPDDDSRTGELRPRDGPETSQTLALGLSQQSNR